MDTILAVGATGQCVLEVTALARAAGVDIPQASDTEPLGEAQIDRILSMLTLADSIDARTPLPGQLYKGKVIDSTVWEELRARAAQNTGLTAPTPPAAVQEAPPLVPPPVQPVS